MSGTLFIRNRQRAVTVDARQLRRFLQSLLCDRLAREHFDLGVYLVDPPEMARLNETFLRHRGSTDVITLDYGDRGRAGSPQPDDFGARRASGPALWGEIFICPDEAVSQARRFRTTWQGELARYVIHGVLHLIGYADRRPADRSEMKRAEDRLLRQLSRDFPIRRLGRRRLRTRPR